MTEMVQDKRGVYVLPNDYDEAQFEISEDQLIFEQFANEARDNEQYSKMTISRVPMNRHGQRGAQKLSFLFEAGIDEYSYSQLLSKLRDEYGSGFYKIQARNDKGQLKLNKTVAVEAPAGDTDKAAAHNPTVAVLQEFTKSQNEQNVELREFMMRSNPPQGTDMIDQVVKIATAIAPLLTALGISRPEPAPPPKSVVEMLTEAKMVTELMGGGNEAQYGEANGWSALTETLKALGPAIGGALAMGAQTPEVAKTEAVPQLEAPPVDEKLEQEKVIEMQKQDLAKQINMLLIQAKGGAKPRAVAEMVVNMTPPEHEEKLWDTIVAENCVDTMAAAVPEVNEHREWFDDLRAGILEIMAEPEIDVEEEHEKILEAARDAESIPNPTADNCPHGVVWGTCSEGCAEDAAHIIETKEMMENLQSDQNGDNLGDSDAVAGAENDTDAQDGDTTGNT